MIKGQGKISRRETLIFFPTRENAMIIINVTIRYTLPKSLRTVNAVIIINVTIRYVLPTRLQRENAMIIINVTFRYVLPTRLLLAAPRGHILSIYCLNMDFGWHAFSKKPSCSFHFRVPPFLDSFVIPPGGFSDHHGREVI